MVLREAPLEWRHTSPVDRAAGRVLQEEFDAAISRLQQKLGAWYAGNAAEKQALIKRAQQLIGKEPREATEAVKQLQQQWKSVGVVERDQEQRLWNEFREHCDAVFQKRAQVQTERLQALDANKVQALAICAEAEQVATLSGTALLEGLAKIPQWRTAFEALGELPRADERSLRERFDRAIKRGQGAVAAVRTREKEMAMSNLLQAAHLIQNYGWAYRRAPSSSRRVQASRRRVYRLDSNLARRRRAGAEGRVGKGRIREGRRSRRPRKEVENPLHPQRDGDGALHTAGRSGAAPGISNANAGGAHGPGP